LFCTAGKLGLLLAVKVLLLFKNQKMFKWHNKKLHDFCSSLSYFNMMKSRRLWWAGYVAPIEETRIAYRILMRTSLWK